MPDPGEPHRPKRDCFASDDDYRDALAEYVRLNFPNDVLRAKWAASQGIHDIEQFLEDHSDR